MVITATTTIIAMATTINTIITTATRVRVDAIINENMVVTATTVELLIAAIVLGETSGVVAHDDTFLSFCFVAPLTTLLSITLLVRERRLPFTSAPACALGALLGAPLMTAFARGA